MSGALEGLLERVESATGPDRELDARIWCAINGYDFVAWDGAGAVYRFREPGIRHMDAAHVQPVTRSVDAALALVERVLPGWSWQIDNSGGEVTACLSEASGSWLVASDKEAFGRHKYAALAILAALLRALFAKAAP